MSVVYVYVVIKRPVSLVPGIWYIWYVYTVAYHNTVLLYSIHTDGGTAHIF